MTSLSLTPRPLTGARRAVLHRRIRWVVAATITYNVIEAVVALTAGTVASSSALIGFGLDSIVEVLSAAAVAWQFAGPDPNRREKPALRLIAISFFGLAAFVTVDAVRSLLNAAEPEHSTVGIVLAAVSVIIMPGLSWFERRTGRELGSASAVADSKQTLICSYLSAVLLVGLLLNSLLGWSWADPIAALVIAGFAVREGIEAWRGDACCTPVSVLTGAKTVFWILLGVVALGVVIGVLVSRSANTTAAPDDAGQLVRENGRVLSKAPDEKAVLVEFLDYECEACAAAYPFIEDLRTEYADTLTVVHRYFPLPGHPNSMTAAIAVEAAAEQGAYEPMYQQMFQPQTQWSHNQQDQSAVFRGYAAVDDPATRQRIELDVADGTALGVAGTPTFYLDGKPLQPDSLDEFTAAVDAATQD